jgi:hypothetical protein
MQQQIATFTEEISTVFYDGLPLKPTKNWFETLELLTKTIEKQTQTITLFFDEFPWMATHRSQLLAALDHYWNRYWSQNPRIKLIIGGSAAALIIRHIIENNGGIHNRLTHTMQLEPMNLRETKQYLHHIGAKLNNQHISKIYMVTGGIPYYLSHIQKNGSSAEIIEQLAFSKNSPLLKEFDKLYLSLFKDGQDYIEIVRIIAKKRYGISQSELFQHAENLSKGGTISNKLKALEEVGFILRFKPYKHARKGIYYKVIDEYSLFYFNWIEPIKDNLLSKGLRKGYWQTIQNTPAWYTWAGYAFEALCYKHLPQIANALNLSPTALPHAWRHTPIKKTQDTPGAQIDLLFDGTDDIITLCEIKHTQKPFVIDQRYAAKLTDRQALFKKITHTNKHLILAIISANGLKKNLYSEGIVDKLVTLDDLFKPDSP